MLAHVTLPTVLLTFPLLSSAQPILSILSARVVGSAGTAGNDTHNQSTSGSHSSLSGGAIAGIVIAITGLLLIALIGIAIVYSLRRRAQRNAAAAAAETLEISRSNWKNKPPHYDGDDAGPLPRYEGKDATIPPYATVLRPESAHTQLTSRPSEDAAKW